MQRAPIGLADLLEVCRKLGYQTQQDIERAAAALGCALPEQARQTELPTVQVAQAFLRKEPEHTNTDGIKPAERKPLPRIKKMDERKGDKDFHVEPLPPRPRSRPAWMTAKIKKVDVTRREIQKLPFNSNLPRHQWRTALSDSLRCARLSDQIDIERLVTQIAANQSIEALPFRLEQRPPRSLDVRVQATPFLHPVRDDRDFMIEQLRKLVGPALKLSSFKANPHTGEAGLHQNPQVAYSGATLLVVAAFPLRRYREPAFSVWRNFAKRLAARGTPFFAFTPHAPQRVPVSLPFIHPLPGFCGHTGKLGQAIEDAWLDSLPEELEPNYWRPFPQALRLMAVLSFAAYLEPDLIRQARRQFVPEASAEIEAAIWFVPFAYVRTSSSLTLERDIQQHMREWALQQDFFDLAKTQAFLTNYRQQTNEDALIQLEEQLYLASGQGATNQASRIMRRVLATLVEAEPEQASELMRWTERVDLGLPPALAATEEASSLRIATQMRGYPPLLDVQALRRVTCLPTSSPHRHRHVPIW